MSSMSHLKRHRFPNGLVSKNRAQDFRGEWRLMRLGKLWL